LVVILIQMELLLEEWLELLLDFQEFLNICNKLLCNLIVLKKESEDQIFSVWKNKLSKIYIKLYKIVLKNWK
jgi:hypothetical protein